MSDTIDIDTWSPEQRKEAEISLLKFLSILGLPDCFKICEFCIPKFIYLKPLCVHLNLASTIPAQQCFTVPIPHNSHRTHELSPNIEPETHVSEATHTSCDVTAIKGTAHRLVVNQTITERKRARCCCPSKVCQCTLVTQVFHVSCANNSKQC